MRYLVILLAAIAFAAALFAFGHTAPAGGEFWHGHPWLDLLSNGGALMAVISAALFVLYAVLVMRRTSANLWFVALAASCFLVLAALLPIADHLHVAKHSEQWLDAGGDVPYQISCAERVYALSLAFSVTLGLVATYGYFARRKT